MSDTVSDILSSVGAYVDQTTDLPTGDELTSRISYIDQAQREWAGAYDWDLLHHTSSIAFQLSGVSVGLDSKFKKLESAVYDVATGTPTPYPEINPADRFLKSTTDKYIYILGNVVGGKSIQINPAIDSASSLQYDWLAFPTSLATLTDVSACPNTEYLTKRTIAFVLESRSDPRFPGVKVDAVQMLRNMVADQDTGSGGKVNRISDFVTQGGYILGE